MCSINAICSGQLVKKRSKILLPRKSHTPSLYFREALFLTEEIMQVSYKHLKTPLIHKYITLLYYIDKICRGSKTIKLV